MNLTTDPWLPVVFGPGNSEQTSLRETFARAHQIRDLALRPHERIAVMRLLLCIAHAAIEGPANRKEWRACRDRIASAAAAYLARPEIARAFNLFGEGPRFLQVADLKPTKPDPDKGSPSKLDMAWPPATTPPSSITPEAGTAPPSTQPSKP